TPHDFVFGRSLGEGSFSTVVEGFEPLTNKYFAVKILDKQHLMRENKTATAITEKDALHRLHRHPFIVKLHYTFQDASSLYFVIDLATNGELLGFIRKHGSLSERAARFYTAELIDALEYMHAKGVIHRDVKPENCLLAQNMHLKITDFGSAKLITSKDGEGMQRRQRASSFVGTAEYVSPELLSNKPVDKECDFWAVGCILFQMISGKPPFKGSTEYLTFQKVMKLDYSFPENFPQEARSLIEKLLVLEPSERLGHVNEDDIRQHVFFTSLDATDKDRFTWTELHNQIPPPMESGIVQPPSQSSSNQPNWNDFIAKANAA
ncbi:Pkinase-domain-containing protein, partial [Ramicandelaber brevisporus]